MKKFEKAFAISVLSGVSLLVPKNGDEVYAMFGKKPPTPAQSTTSTTMGPPSKTMAKPGGISVGKIKSVIQDSPKSIDKRNNLLSQIKEGFNSTGGKELLPIEPILSLLHHEPDKYKRNLDKGVRSHTHIDLSNDIKVKLDVGIESGKLKSIVVKTNNKKLVVDAETGNRRITEIDFKSEDKSGGASSVQPKTSDDKSKDVRPKTQQISISQSSGAVSKKKTGEKLLSKEPHRIIREGTSEVNNKKAIDEAYGTGARDIKVLEKVMSEYFGGGKKSQGLYSFYNGDDHLDIRVNSLGDVTWAKVTKTGVSFEKNYDSSVKNIPKQKIDVKALIEEVYKSKGLDEGILKNAVKNHDGDIQRTSKEDIHKFVSGENILNIHTDENGDLSYVILKYGGEVLEVGYPIDESEFLTKSETFYKLGSFAVSGSDLFLQKEVFEGIDSRGNKRFFVKNNEGGVDIVVETKNGFFSKVMSSEQQKLFENIQSTDTLIVKNKDGSSKRVLVETIDVNGVKMTVAHQLEDGLWRIVEKNQDGSLYLGLVVRYENLPKNIQGKLRAAVKAYEGYGKLLTGIKDIMK